MKTFSFLVCLSCAALVAAAPQGYKYQPSTPVFQTGNLRPQTPISTSGIYSVSGQQQLSLPISQPISQPIPQSISQTISQPVAQPVQPTIGTIVATPQPLPQQQVTYQQQQQQQQQQPQQQFVSTIQSQPQQQFVTNFQQPQIQTQPQIQIQSQVVNPSQQPFVQTQYVQRPSIVTKDIYIHSAPDDIEELHTPVQLDNTPIRKNYRIVFIKAPTQNLKQTAAALKRAQASNEEKTVIYVLTKKPDINEIHQHLQLTQTEHKVHKPEVYFIKYKTTEEAQRAQQEIQAQYDALGGATHISDEGVAPISSFSGGSLNLGNIVPRAIQQQTQSQSIIQTGQSVGVIGQGIQQQNSFVPSIGGLQTSTLSQGSNFGVSVPSRRYIPAKTK